MYFNTLTICESLQNENYASPHNKLSSLKKQGHYYQVRQGLYETERDIPEVAYPHETLVKTYKDRGFLIATPEKALCDTLYKTKHVGSVKTLKELLFENLRIDETEFQKLNFQTLQFLCPLYRKKNLNFLNKLIEKMLSKGEI